MKVPIRPDGSLPAVVGNRQTQRTFGRGRSAEAGKSVDLKASEDVMELDDIIPTLKPKPAVYVLEPLEGNYRYKGSSRDLIQRMKDHRAGRVRHTKNKRPLRLVYYEYFENYTDARKREAYLKTGAGRDFLKSVLENS